MDMNKYKILHIISKAGVYLITFSSIFIIQKLIIGTFIDIRQFVLFNKFYVYEIILTITSILIIKKFLVISSPCKDKLNNDTKKIKKY
jgi:hypothetical protein